MPLNTIGFNQLACIVDNLLRHIVERLTLNTEKIAGLCYRKYKNQESQKFIEFEKMNTSASSMTHWVQSQVNVGRG